MNYNYCDKERDFGGKTYIIKVEQEANQNPNFRTAVWTGTYMQMTLMCIPVNADIGKEIHNDTDQFIRVEQGRALVRIGKTEELLEGRRDMCKGEGIFVPAGTWHNIINIGRCPLRVSSIYAPPHHSKGTIHHTKTDADE